MKNKELKNEVLSIIKRLNSFNIDFIIIGGFAKYLHSIEDDFKDIDLYISKELNFSDDVINFLRSYNPNYSNPKYEFKDILRMRIGTIQIDFLPRLDGLIAENIFNNVELIKIESEEVKVLSLYYVNLNIQAVEQKIR